MSDPRFRVLHVSAGREWRGGQKQATLLMKGLRRRGDVPQALAAPSGSRMAREAGGLEVEVLPLRWRLALDPRTVAGLAAVPGDRGPGSGGLTVMHAHDSHALQAALLALALRGGPAGLVASRRMSRPVRASAVWRRAHLVLAVSPAVRDSLLERGVDRRRVRVVPDGVDPEELRPRRPGRLRSAAGAGPDETLVGSVGALEDLKDHGTFLRAAARVAERRPDVRFVVAGEGPARARLEALRSRLGLEGRMALPGHVPEVARSLSDLDLFVMTSPDEGLGSAALEAMAAGVPVVLVRAGGLAHVAGDVLPTVPPRDPAALAAEMLSLLGDGEALERAKRAGERRVERFSVARMVRETAAAYRDVASLVDRRSGVRS